MSVYRMTNNERKSLYPEMYRECFHRDPPVIDKDIFVIHGENGPASFMSGLWVSPDEFYIRVTGAVPSGRGGKRVRTVASGYFVLFMQHINAKYFSTRSEVGDTASQKILADLNFLVHGFRMTTGGVGFVEWVKQWRS